MIRKMRSKPKELELLGCLDSRSELMDKDAQSYLNSLQGFDGECEFDKLLSEALDGKCSIVLNDLLLEHNGTMFQIDSLVITPQKIIVFEVKNYKGDFYAQGEQWFSKSGTEIKNPLHQLRRCEAMLRQLLQSLRINLLIESHLIFINPEFYLYQAPIDPPIVFYPQISRYLKQLNNGLIGNVISAKQEKLASKLLSLHIEESPFTRLPDYEYSEVRKGILCPECHNGLTAFPRLKLLCEKCGHVERIDAGIIRSVREFQILFPKRKITTNSIFEWCDVVESKLTIRRVLQKEMKQQGQGQHCYYI
ncbi:nuclease-related domain-containing protein [Aquibacillus kalidii]|uniref:nuclease-related domain-containing protein n=1 Tax=Aquibacillus kalidii TaxID=2762597 RepID=UPI0016469D5E|nr:nuclease-related domain-containing protein [Aquibacillus kalidii]